MKGLQDIPRYRCIFFVLLCIVSGWFPAGCEGPEQKPKRFGTGPFTEVDKIPEQLHRGQSTEQEVRMLLGEPSGRGHMILPPDHDPCEIWYYEDMEVLSYVFMENPTSSAIVPAEPATTIIQLDFRQQILLIFMRNGIFNGYLWSSNAMPATGYARPSF